MKKEFSLGDRVEMENCGELSGAIGIVVGMSATFAEIDFYIVLMDNEVKQNGRKWKAIVMIESCMRKIM